MYWFERVLVKGIFFLIIESGRGLFEIELKNFQMKDFVFRYSLYAFMFSI